MRRRYNGLHLLSGKTNQHLFCRAGDVPHSSYGKIEREQATVAKEDTFFSCRSPLFAHSFYYRGAVGSSTDDQCLIGAARTVRV
jgi:hypothetical protein